MSSLKFRCGYFYETFGPYYKTSRLQVHRVLKINEGSAIRNNCSLIIINVPISSIETYHRFGCIGSQFVRFSKITQIFKCEINVSLNGLNTRDRVLEDNSISKHPHFTSL